MPPRTKPTPTPGHLFIVDGDLTKLACDAVMVPTDSRFTIEPKWNPLVDRDQLPDSWDDEVVLLHRRGESQPWVWLADVGLPGEHSDFTPFAPKIRAFVEMASAAINAAADAERIYPWPNPRLAVNLIGSGEGGGRQRKGDLVKSLVGELERLSRQYQVDLVLVTYGAKAYAAAQRARHQLMGDKPVGKTWTFEEDSSERLVAEAERIASAALESQLVLFIGAGVSAGAGLPTWSDLLSEIAVEYGLDKRQLELLRKKDLRDQAAILERRLRSETSPFKSRIAARLEERKQYSLQHGLLASLPSEEAVTTNFDLLFEAAATTGGRKLAVLPEHPQSSCGRWLLKLHGTVDNSQELILTRSDYLQMPKQYGALMGLVQGMLLMRHMMFVGYSLKDEDFHELIHEVRSARGTSSAGSAATGTILTLFDDELERELWEDDLHVVPMVLGRREAKDVAVVARQLEIFLDLVGYLATTSAAFFLDLSYRVLSDDEKELRDLLVKLAAETKESPEGSVGYQVRRFLIDLGAEE
ncbi:SIR2 family protein [Mycolicibacterium cyprinidarum]|uniref:SIR2 family protein n=1 Tax=Mycolicibacterium cyprinidarum TaxID=2860311 RepID=A0ABQ4V8N8_9MYCO|nr:SIR2 family protein [Mycolicibacterium sp. NGTWS0302]GJF14220.1 SIR2 family protein [Mycolicibacterium sp. NGTWSNA01]